MVIRKILVLLCLISFSVTTDSIVPNTCSTLGSAQPAIITDCTNTKLSDGRACCYMMVTLNGNSTAACIAAIPDSNAISEAAATIKSLGADSVISCGSSYIKAGILIFFGIVALIL